MRRITRHRPGSYDSRKTPPSNPQREDLVMRRKKERAALLPRERKTANCFEAPEATHSDRGPARQPAADEHELYRERATLACRGMARPQNRCHRVCKQPKPARSKAASAMTESHHSDHCRLRVRHSQPDTTTLLVSKSPATRSLQQPSAISRWTEIQRARSKVQANVRYFSRQKIDWRILLKSQT